MPASADVVILGAGPAGLAAAWRAARRGLSVTVLDRAPVVGGMAGSFDVAGVRVDHGSHRLHPATPPEVLADLRGLLGDDLQLRPRNGRLNLGDRWVGFPLRLGELAGALPPQLVAGIARDMAVAPLRRSTSDTYAGALRASLGPTLYEAMHGPYARKLWGLDGEQLDAEQARKRVTADTPAKIAARILRRPKDGQGRVFHYPRRGFGQIVDALAEAACAAGAEIRLGTAVSSVVPAAEGVRVGEVAARHLLTTVPLPALARLVSGGPPDPGLRFRAMLLVYVVHEGGRWSPYDAHYVPGPATPITRISEPANYRDSADDPADRTVLCCEIPCAIDDPLWTRSESSLGELVVDGLAALGLPPVRLGGVHVRRVPQVYPIYERGYGERLAALDEWAGGLSNVTTFGRLGLFVHDNTHHAIVMANEAVDALLPGGGIDAPRWAAARERFSHHVVED